MSDCAVGTMTLGWWRRLPGLIGSYLLRLALAAHSRIISPLSPAATGLLLLALFLPSRLQGGGTYWLDTLDPWYMTVWYLAAVTQAHCKPDSWYATLIELIILYKINKKRRTWNLSASCIKYRWGLNDTIQSVITVKCCTRSIIQSRSS